MTTNAVQSASASTADALKTDRSHVQAETFDVNVNGQTIGEYGVGLKGDPGANPQLVRAVSSDGVAGYVYTADVFGTPASSPEQALDQQRSRQASGLLSEREVHLYKEDGRTVIGVYVANATR